MIFADPRNPTAQQLREKLEARFPDGVPHPETDVVIGGDGFLLHTVARHGFERQYLGLNAGRLGFLLNDANNLEQVFDQLERGAWEQHAFPLVEADVVLHDGERKTVYAVNDIYLQRATGQMAHLSITVDGERVVERLVSDGVIFSTALGSTAYTISAGGPACHPSLQVLLITSICPHHPRLAPLALPASSRVQVEVLDSHRRPVSGVTDGLTVGNVLTAGVRLSDSKVKLAYFEGHGFTSQLIRKILKP